MSGLDVEALLDSTANGFQDAPEPVLVRNDRKDDRHHRDRRSSRDRERDFKRRDRSRDRRRRDHDDVDMTKSPRSDRGSANGSHKSRHRSRSRDDSRHRRRERRRSDAKDDRGDYYRGPGRARTRTRSKSPDSDRYYRPGDRRRSDREDREDRVERNGRGRGGRRRSPTPRRRTKSPTPQPTEDERDRRTVFVQQLAARLRTKELIAFFEKVGPVKEAQIVKDRVSGRSKGVGYVEFKEEDSVALAIQLTGQKLLGIPIIAQLTEAEKNRQARTTESGSTATNGVPFHRLYVGNIHFSITEEDLQEVFEPFGELEFVQLQKEDQGRSRGYGFVQFRDPTQAKEALEHLNGFEIAGRPIRVGLGNDKFTPESTQNLLQKFNGLSQPSFQGSDFSGRGGRGAHAGGAGGSFDRAGGRDTDKGTGGASALDDTDVAGVNFNNFSRDALMRKLARTDDSTETHGKEERAKLAKPRTETRPTPVNVSQASRCVLLKNCFDPAEEESDGWVQELEDEVRKECNDKYGTVVHIAVDPNTQGDIYIKFDKISGGENAIRGLNGRFFGGKTISAQPVVDAVYSSLFARTRAL
ncbi:splicing factor, CC1-like protein [Pseudovirgaria hyperparasitica]|uniref:Splicing factor, CC1-like protein n=1 Tax=Pseudovirgaria hyperparasitica TaxID=470096 RepID=A0A6A6W4M8_9PEZI|nr:splicing factor, CC1-like protein [Pseudovirgaria hyperparasitica]KAF2756994.1 splicing factor, CC1-like protein [Pseudovirgaria hyperparasitica]